ncbi:Ig-like domain-containing protein [uncultured Paraglaciecola sp.]|uniref:Ig-like domain-containing protein n=1 Tax=uncultured Paraglaciecola sp. TaxID=1765024 RepID=UPI0025F55C02|nr:Ig-like domain-containing protein [uncultured Paraglaciecola sp.]
MRKYSYFVFIAVFLLNSCGGGVSGENGIDPFGTGSTSESLSISLAILDQQCEVVSQPSFTAGETLCVQATVSQNSNLITGEIVSFSTDVGSLSAESKITDSNGVAQIFIESGTGDVGASTLAVSFGGATSESSYEFLAKDIIVLSALTIDLTILKNGVAVNRFKASEQVQIQAVISDENLGPVENIIVSFTTGKGTLNTSDALTDGSGMAQVTLIPEDTDIGAAVVSALILVDNDTELLASINFAVQAADVINAQIIRIGHFDADNVFVENEIGISAADLLGNVEISAGATLGISLAIVDENDQRILTQTPVTFTSSCAKDGFANIDQQVNTINGEAVATYEDISCAGGDGNEDVIVASLVVNNSTISITRSISILAESVGSITFVSADPTQLVLQGTGGQNSQTVSTLVFQVNGVLGNPLAQQNVTFSLNTQTGGLSLSPASGITNSQGQVSARVTSGNVPTSVRVTADVVTNSGVSVLTQSDLLAVNTGLPDQNSFTLSANRLNPEAYNISGQTVSLVARLADTFNNPVPDGTSVSFTTEGGVIAPSCATTNGTCSVTWTSSNPRTLDHRVTILATAIGHETLFDANGNNSFDDADGIAIIDGTDSGFGTSQSGTTGFIDHSEAWRDDNANLVKDDSEIFLDYNNNGQFDVADSLFNGPQCNSANTCGQGSANTLHVRRSLEIVTASSVALLDILNQAGDIIFSNHQAVAEPSLVLEQGEAISLLLQFSDTAIQSISSNSTIRVTSNAGLLAGQINTLMRETNKSGASVVEFTLTNDRVDTGGVQTTATVNAEVVSPSGVVSVVIFVVALN